MRVELENGAWAEVREDPENVSNGQRRAIMRLYATVDEPIERLDMVADELMKLFVLAWSLDLPLPRDDAESLTKMRARDYDLLAAAVRGMEQHLFVSFKVDPEPGSPT